MNKETYVDNVFLFGAGASYDAGIPLLGNFVEVMNQMVLTRRSPKGPLSATDQECLERAMALIHGLEPYHARVAIDQFNLEQVLSVLAFEAYAGGKTGEKDMRDFAKAISRTVELNCNVLHDGNCNQIQETGAQVYRSFWSNLFVRFPKQMAQMPTILTFNYDLVLERALFQFLNGTLSQDTRQKSGCTQVSLKLLNPNCGPSSYRIEPTQWPTVVHPRRPLDMQNLPGFVMVKTDEGEAKNCAVIPLLKLHGSLSFPKEQAGADWSPVVALPEPDIIPPVFNKADGTFASAVWRSAMVALRSCRQLIICGYSLPTTDTYMQYFLKSALGPNRSLQNILVFDPQLFREDQGAQELRKRYSECFSPQMQTRINFKPKLRDGAYNIAPGTFAHLVDSIDHANLLFGVMPKNA